MAPVIISTLIESCSGLGNPFWNYFIEVIIRHDL